MAIKINTAYGERLTSGMLNEKISNLVGGNEKLSGFDVSIASPTSVTIKPGKAIINGCAIEETSDTNTVVIDPRILSNDSIAYVVIDYSHENKRVVFSCVNSVANTMVKLATLFIKDGVISELTNHTTTKTLSTVVAEAAEIEAQKIRDSIPSGFVELGELDYDYMLNNENQVKLKTKSVAYVNGYRVEIPANTIINIGKAPEKESREDLLFLEAWKDSDFNKDGKLKWRIRHVADVDFEKYTLDGFTSDSASAVYANINTDIKPQGALDKPIDLQKENTVYWEDSFFNYKMRNKLSLTGDVGVYVCGNNVNRTGALDGYVYAIPMFRLYRKPSCGKAIPFEYSKINPKVDYDKFTKLIKDDKVERVISENIKGRSLVNCAYSTSINLTKNLYSPLTHDGIIKSNTEYTLCFNISKITGSATGKILRLIIRPTGGSSDTSNDITINVTSSSFTTGKVKVKIPSQTVSIARLYIHLSGGAEGDSIALTEVMLLEGNWTNKEIPTSFTGLKSLGEDDGNLITIKNGILNDDTYDINDGNQKLIAFSEVTHINSTNTIIPTIEANVIKGEESTPLEKLGSKLETEGHEVIEFTKIKGKTLQNLVNLRNKVYSVGSTIDSQITPALKSNTWYTLIIQINNNTLNKPVRVSGYNLVGGQGEIRSESDFAEDTNIFNVGENGTWKGKFSILTFGSSTPSLTLFSDNATSGSYVASAMLLEGDHTNTPLEELPFVEGIKSVGENEGNTVNLTSVGKNLISKDMYTNNWFMGDSINEDRYDTTGKLYSIYGIKTFGCNPLTLSCNKPFDRMVFRGRNSEGNVIYQGNLGSINKTSLVFNDIPSEVVTLDLYVHSKGIDYTYDFMLEEGEVVNPYKPYQRYNQNIYLREPLRSLPNGVCDEIVGNKVIRRVGKDTFTGSAIEDWKEDTARHLEKTLYFEIPKVYNNARSIRCSHFQTKLTGDSASVWGTDSEVCNYDNYWNMLVIRINRSRLATQDLAGFKKWLSENNVTVVHGLVKEIEEPLVNVYEKESIKTYQLDAPLRSLPNGVKDEIKDGVLIRRCGEVTINGSENWEGNNTENTTTQRYILGNYLVNCNSVAPDSFINDKLPCSSWSDNLMLGISITRQNIFIYNNNINTGLDLKNWLNDNPIKIVYELATPTETILTEAKPQTADFSLQRQFGEGNWLRELPNGVKDTIENGKVIRRVGKVVLNGNEPWTYQPQNSGRTNTLLFTCKPPSPPKSSYYAFKNVLSDRFYCKEVWTIDSPGIYTDATILGVAIYKNDLSDLSVSGFNSWLKLNPTTVLYELATPVEETLSTDNYMPYPCHDFNTYCGSMYVGQGRNHVVNVNKMPSENNIIIETDFREIDGNSKVEDCNFKKSDEGYDTMCLLPTNKNLFDGIWEKGMINTDGSIAETQSTTRKYSKNFIRVIPGKTYIFSANLGEDRINLKGYDLNKKLVHNFGYSAKHTIPEGCYFVRFYNGHDSSVNLDNIKAQFELGETVTSYVEGINTFRSFENTESNDIDDLRHQVSLTGFNYDKILNESFDKLLKGEL